MSNVSVYWFIKLAFPVTAQLLPPLQPPVFRWDGGSSHCSLILSPSCNPQHPEQTLLSAGPGAGLWAPSAGKFKISRARKQRSLATSISSSCQQIIWRERRWQETGQDFPHLQHTSNKIQKPKKSRTAYFSFSNRAEGSPSVSYEYIVSTLICLCCT